MLEPRCRPGLACGIVYVPVYAALLAALPLLALALAVFRTELSLGTAAWIVTAGASALAVAAFGLSPAGLLAGAAKGAWTGVWILLLVVPALLLFQVADSTGGLDRLSDALGDVAPTPGRRLLLIGWAFPSFLQGAAGFGVPVVVAAPMLVRTGMAPAAAVAACLVGYHWSVTFGSMGSSFFVAVGTANLPADEAGRFAVQAAILLAVGAAATAAVLLRQARGLRRDGPRAAGVAVVMGTTLVGVAAVQPALGSTAAGLAGLLAAWLLFPRAGERPQARPLLLASSPYLLLTGLVVAVFGVPQVRELAEQVPALAPSFPETIAAFGHVNAAVAAHQPLRPLLHPGPYLLVAAAVGALVYRRLGWWPQDRWTRAFVAPWARRSRSTIVSLLGLTTLAGVMVDAGMLAAMAQALTAALGLAFVPLAVIVGAGGTVLTGSTTASNALLAPLQADAAAQLGLAPTTLLVAQTVGGNIGNALTPINAVIAAAAVGASGAEGEILRRALKTMLPVAAVAVVGVVALALLDAV